MSNQLLRPLFSEPGRPGRRGATAGRGLPNDRCPRKSNGGKRRRASGLVRYGRLDVLSSTRDTSYPRRRIPAPPPPPPPPLEEVDRLALADEAALERRRLAGERAAGDGGLSRGIVPE